MRKRIQKIAIVLGIFIVLALCVGFLFIRSETFLNWVEKRIESELENRITKDYTADIGNIKGSIFGNVAISDIKIAKAGDPVISTRQVVLKYNWLELLTRKFEVKALSVTEPKIHAKPDSDGTLNLSNIFRTPSDEDTSPFSFAVRKVQFSRGTIDYVNTQRNLDIQIDGITIDVSGPLDTWNHQGAWSIADGSLTFNGTETRINNFEGDFLFSVNDSTLDKLFLKFGNSSLAVAGNCAYGEAGTPWGITLDLLKLDVADVAQFVGEGTELEGIVQGRLTVNGTDSSIDGALSLETPTFSITRAENDRHIALTALKIDANLTSEPIPTVTLKTFTAQVADGTLSGTGSIRLQNRLVGDLTTQLQQLTAQPLVYDGQWHATDMQLVPLLSMFVQLPDYLTDSTGLLAANATFNGNSSDLSTFNLNSTIEITGATLNAVALTDSTLRCIIEDAQLKADGDLHKADINITGTFPLAEQESLDIHIARINFDDLMRIVNSADLGGTGEYTAKLAADGTLRGTMKIPNASFNDIPIGVLAGNLNYQDGQIFIENGLLTKNTKKDIVTAYQSRTTITGVVDIEGDFPAAFNVSADPVYVQHYPRILLGAGHPVDGEIRGELKLNGTLINLDGSADFSVTEGVAWGIHLDPLTLPLRIEDYNITIPDFEVTTRNQKVTINVAVAPNGDFDFLLENDTPVDFQALAQAARIPDFPFDGQFDVQVVGTLKRPANLDLQVELDFTDIAFLNSGRATKHPLSDVFLHGKLVELRNVTGEPDRFDFTGNGFNGQIQGRISTAPTNPYQFEIKSSAVDVAPILRILHPALEAVTGTAAGHAEIKGTVADLAPMEENESGESDEQRIYPYDVDIEIESSQLHYENPSTKLKTPFTNAEHIRLSLRNDTWIFEAFSLSTAADKPPFIQLTGSFDAKSEVMDLDAKAEGFALSPFDTALGLPTNTLHAGTGRYTLKMTGTPQHPNVGLEWAIPMLDLRTAAGDIRISDAGGALVYRDNLMRCEKMALTLLGNRVDIGGEIDVHPEDVSKSRLNISLNAPDLELATFAALIAQASAGSIDVEDLTGGTLGVAIDITGTPAETLIAVHARTIPQQPIRLIANVNPITLESLHANATLNAHTLNLQSVMADGQIGNGSYRVQGNVSFSTRDTKTQQFAVDVSVSELAVVDILTVLSGQVLPLRGSVSGQAKLSGKGSLNPDYISIIGEVSTLDLQGYGIRCTNTTPLQFQSERGHITARLPLALKSSEMATMTDVNITGTLAAPEITAEWSGDINEMEWNGKVEYRDQRVALTGIEIKNRAGTSTINGVIPFDLANISDQFPDEPIDVRFRGTELPLDFFPGIDTLFSEADATVDIDLALQGTSSDPHIAGTVSLEAAQLQLRHFHEPIRNMKVKLNAREDAIDLTALDFDIGTGYWKLQQAQLTLDGLLPKDFTLKGLKCELFPLGSTVQQAVSLEMLKVVKGHFSTTLNELTIPFDTFLTKSENTPFPHIRKLPSLTDIVEVSNAKLSINSVQFAFEVLDRRYDFQDPRPIQVLLNAGKVTLPEDFILEDQENPFQIKQTFTDEDEKPEGVTGNVYTIENAKTVLKIDAESYWSANGEFDAALRFNNFDVSVLTETWPTPYRITGALSGNLQMKDTSDKPKITLRRHKADPAELYLHDVPIDLRWRIRYENGAWTILKEKPVTVHFGENLLTFSWDMPYELKLVPFFTELQQSPETVWRKLQQTNMIGILDIKVNDVDLLSSVVPGLSTPTGEGRIHVTLTGTVETPHAEGNVHVEDIGFEMSEAGIAVKSMTGDVALSEQGATITALNGVLNDGPFSIAGSLLAPPDGRLWEEPPTLDVQTSISSALFEQPGAYQIKLGAKPTQLRLKGTFDEPALTGNLNISQGYYKQNWQTVMDWFGGASVSEVDLLLNYPILRDLYVNVDIDIPDNFRVLSSITGPTDIEISSSGGKLIGPIRQPVFNGTVSVLGGKIGFVLQTFEFIEGSRITNRSPVEFDPDLRIFLRTPDRIRGVLPRDASTVDLEINTSLTGTLKNPEFVMSAANTTEILSHEEIMTFLVRHAAFSRAFGGFTFNFHRPHDIDARSISAEYQLRENMSIKIENNEKGEYGVDVEMKGRF